jgi:hypothetical protein
MGNGIAASRQDPLFWLRAEDIVAATEAGILRLRNRQKPRRRKPQHLVVRILSLFVRGDWVAPFKHILFELFLLVTFLIGIIELIKAKLQAL